jgi:hypothetical protein
MKVTADSLFHFTDSLNNLESILTKKFKMTYCKETYQLDNTIHKSYFPMVSFCDIPLALAKDQIDKYGSYSIGLSKSWGIKNRLNPVIYIEKSSIISSELSDNLAAFKKINSHFNNIFDKMKSNIEDFKNLFDEYVNGFSNSLSLHRYLKNYQGDLIRKTKTFKNYRFYDEREWRYVPYFKYGDRYDLSEEDYLKYRKTSKEKPLLDEVTLNFFATDIKYLIVKSNKDIPKLIRIIKRLDNLTSNPDQADVLSTKILTVEQINEDF